MRISDWSSDVCSSDLLSHRVATRERQRKASSGALRLPVAQRRRDRDRFVADHLGEFDAPAVRARTRCCDDQRADHDAGRILDQRSEEHTSELQSLMRISYAVFCLKKKNTRQSQIRK